MTPAGCSAFERDLVDQNDALRVFADQPIDQALSDLDLKRFDRIILTGMGSSDSVTIPFETVLARRGLPVWRMQTSRLLDMPELITPRTVLWLTSQSGRSGEIVTLLPVARERAVARIVAVTNDAESPLGEAADVLFRLHSGSEATVSCKSYMNSLGCYHRIATVLETGSDDEAVADLHAVVAKLAETASAFRIATDDLAERIMAERAPRIALIGTGSDCATALAGALILKEAAKVSAEGYAGGAFRHGPIEIAGPGLLAIMFGDGADSEQTFKHLAFDLARTGTIVVAVTKKQYEGAQHLALNATSQVERLMKGMSFVQQLSVSIARHAGIIPGEFRFGQKITSTL